MHSFRWAEVSGARDCLRCAVLDPDSPPPLLKRTLKLLQGDVASVRLECPSCGFCLVGIVNVEGNEGVMLAAPHEAEIVYDPGPLRAATPQEPQRSSPANDDEGLQSLRESYPDAIGEAELSAIVQNSFPASIQSGRVTALRGITRREVMIGDTGKMVGFEVAYTSNGNAIWQGTYFNLDGTPKDLDADIRKAALAVEHEANRTVTGPRPRPTPTYTGRAVGIRASTDGGGVQETRMRFGNSPTVNTIAKQLGIAEE